MLTTKIGMAVQDWSDRFCEVAQKTKWISLLRRSRRDDQNTYMERPIWTSDERDMASRSSTPRSDRFVGAVRPVFVVKSELGVVI